MLMHVRFTQAPVAGSRPLPYYYLNFRFENYTASAIVLNPLTISLMVNELGL